MIVQTLPKHYHNNINVEINRKSFLIVFIPLEKYILRLFSNCGQFYQNMWLNLGKNLIALFLIYVTSTKVKIKTEEISNIWFLNCLLNVKDPKASVIFVKYFHGNFYPIHTKIRWEIALTFDEILPKDFQVNLPHYSNIWAFSLKAVTK